MWSNTLSSLQYCKYRYFTGIATNRKNENKKTKTLWYNLVKAIQSKPARALVLARAKWLTLFRKEGHPAQWTWARVYSWPLCPRQQLSRMFWLTRFARVDAAGRASGRCPFNQNFRNLRNNNTWYRNFPEKFPEIPKTGEFPIAKHSNENSRNSGRKMRLPSFWKF